MVDKYNFFREVCVGQAVKELLDVLEYYNVQFDELAEVIPLRMYNQLNSYFYV